MEIIIALAVVLGIMLIQAITMVGITILYAKLKGDCFSINKPWEDAKAMKPHKPLFKPKETPETAEEKRQRILSENIDNYNGTKEGQTRI